VQHQVHQALAEGKKSEVSKRFNRTNLDITRYVRSMDCTRRLC